LVAAGMRCAEVLESASAVAESERVERPKRVEMIVEFFMSSPCGRPGSIVV
jgi:hypothetical protein